ncbi:MAG: hydroxyacylglutathione hydrolase, partial [Mesorhizobium sp.]
MLGGGFTGGAVAWHLARQSARPLITVIESRPFLGGGLAYSSEEPSHRVNVPASRMSLSPDEPEHFSRWLAHGGEVERDPDAVWRNDDIYPRRHVFG